MVEIGVIGGGSIGLLLAGYLCKAGFNVTIYTTTKEQAMQLNRNGLTIQIGRENLNYSIKGIPYSEVKQFNDDYLFIAVKQYHLKQVIPSLGLRLGKVTSIIFMQNGMGHLKYFDKLRPKVKNVLVAIVEHGALKQAASIVRHTGVGEMKIGYVQNGEHDSEAVWDSLTAIGFLTNVYGDWLEIMERKLLVNAVINPLTAIFKVRNGMLVENKYYLQLMRQLFDEISCVIKCNNSDWKRIIEICKQTRANRSSMLRDIEEGRVTEIDAITGIILEKGKIQKQSLPLNDFILKSVKGMENEERRGTSE
ncbi:MAG: 2-dehydropantoate 2-reductase [Anaerobacillus sp.]|uniref:2-dehydropantoate 2-reductase n=1 Tax=Anaerobacillus sp. TaxID=1872506 RepID=UPI00391B79B3